MTVELQCLSIPGKFSTHILTRRMTNAPVLLLHANAFQLTSSQGGWLFLTNPKALLQFFNSHPHKEDDVPNEPAIGATYFFQLTSSQGGWHNRPMPFSEKSFFNSHPHKEDDLLTFLFVNSIIFSTHILTRRMTATLNKNTLSKTARIIPFEYNTLKIYIFSNSYLLFFWKSTPFSGANLPENFCALIIRTKISKYP